MVCGLPFVAKVALVVTAIPARGGSAGVGRDAALGLDRLEAVQTTLKVLRRVTGLRIALVARTTEDSWTACAVLDEAGFGLGPGDELPLHDTY